MHVGGDYHAVAPVKMADMSGKENLEYNLRHGVKHITIYMRHPPGGKGWNLDEMKRIRDNCDRHGVTWEAIRMEPHYIRAREKDARIRELDLILNNISKAAAVGVKVMTYHWTVIPIQRNRDTPGRGGSAYRGFKLFHNWESLDDTSSGRVTHEDYWDRISIFLMEAVPVAEQHDVRLACHPYDPPGLPFGYRGVDNWNSPDVFGAIKRYESIVDSHYNGFQVCLGTLAEGVKNVRKEVPEIVRYLGDRDKIHQIHMRNIKGAFLDFEEVYTDEGVMDFVEIVRILRDTGYRWSICPDHMPSHKNDPEKLQAFAFGTGYIRGIIDSVNREVQ